jgi:two-component system cell cycle sensor histidine kinase PleC
LGKSTPRSSQADLLAPPEERSLAADNRRTWGLIFGILGLLTLALGLKGWDEHMTQERAFLAQIDGEARMLAARIASRAEAAQVVLRLVGQEDLSTSRVAAIAPGMDALVSLRDAAQSPAGSRLGDAATLGAELRAHPRKHS